MLNTTSLEYFNKPGIPDHELKLKGNDICFLLSAISRKDNLSRNTRVIKILKINQYRIKIATLGNNPLIFSDVVPRMLFKVTYSNSFTLLIRRQFPLCLAFAMTKNKSQGQGLEYMINADISKESFAQGQEYVAFSRPFDIDLAAVYCTTEQLLQIDDEVYSSTFNNVVYNELL
jgi:hypothetical protein